MLHILPKINFLQNWAKLAEKRELLSAVLVHGYLTFLRYSQ